MTARWKSAVTAILVALILLTLAFIFGNSLKPASASTVQSNGFTELLGRIFRLPPETVGNPDFRAFVRAAAHFSEFALLGVEITALLLVLGAPRIALAGGGIFLILVAAADEGIQRFVPGRAADISDVLVDSVGGLFGGAVAFAVFLLLSQFLCKKKERC